MDKMNLRGIKFPGLPGTVYMMPEYNAVQDDATDLANLVEPGRYRYSSTTENLPEGLSAGFVDVVAQSSSFIWQIFHDSTYMTTASRIKAGPATVPWGQLLWENPPMVPGVEYRTTERWQGKPVYTMLVDCGGMVNGKRVDVDVEHTDILRHAAVMEKNSLPLINYETYVSAQHVGQTAIAILMYSGSESFQGMATYTQIWYTKD